MPSSFPSPIRIQAGVSGAVPGGGANFDLYANAGVPAFSALRGSRCVDTTNRALYINTSAGVSGTTWTQVGSGAGASFAAAIGPSSAVTAKALTNFDISASIPANTLAVGDIIVVTANITPNVWGTKAVLTTAVRLGGATGVGIASASMSGKAAVAGSYQGRFIGQVVSIGAKGSVRWFGTMNFPTQYIANSGTALQTAVDTTGALPLTFATQLSAGANSRTLAAMTALVIPST